MKINNNNGGDKEYMSFGPEGTSWGERERSGRTYGELVS